MATHPDFFYVLLELRRARPPLALFRIFERGQWFPISPRFYHVRIPEMTSQSLKAEISKLLKTGEKVSVHGVSMTEESGRHSQPIPWESLYRRHTEKRRMQRHIRQATQRRRRKQ